MTFLLQESDCCTIIQKKKRSVHYYTQQFTEVSQNHKKLPAEEASWKGAIWDFKGIINTGFVFPYMVCFPLRWRREETLHFHPSTAHLCSAGLPVHRSQSRGMSASIACPQHLQLQKTLLSFLFPQLLAPLCVSLRWE